MRNFYAIQLLAGLLVFLAATCPALGADGHPPEAPEQIVFQRAAVASFLVGRHKPHMDEAMDDTLICPIGEICREDPAILPHAGIALTRLVDQQLQSIFSGRVASRTDVRLAEAQIALDPQQDTPLSLAEKLGRLLEVDMLVIGTVWRYRERGALEGVPDSGASVAFAIYFVDAASGRQLWRGLYEATQQTVLEDLFQARKQVRMGLRWLNADELAAHGVEEVFRQLPATIQAGTLLE
jgi:hypothetical protein